MMALFCGRAVLFRFRFQSNIQLTLHLITTEMKCEHSVQQILNLTLSLQMHLIRLCAILSLLNQF